jgi:DNA-binding MarR family transcriptional regulator
MAEKYVLFSLEDEKAKSLGDVISNNTARKIANLLVEKPATESEIAKELGIPLNTVDYNIKKLVKSGLIEEKKHFFSAKGKRVSVYKIANKLIILAPKKSSAYSKMKSVIPVILISGILTVFIAWHSRTKFLLEKGVEKIPEEAMIAGVRETGKLAETPHLVWLWFLAGAFIAIVIFLIWNWKKL